MSGTCSNVSHEKFEQIILNTYHKLLVHFGKRVYFEVSAQGHFENLATASGDIPKFFAARKLLDFRSCSLAAHWLVCEGWTLIFIRLHKARKHFTLSDNGRARFAWSDIQ